MLTTNQVGAIAEAEIVSAALKRGVGVFSELDRAFLVPAERIDGRSHIQLRVRPPKSNQTIGVNWADDFDFAATLERLQGP